MKRWIKAAALAVFIAAFLWLTPGANASMLTFDANDGGVKTYWIDSTGYIWGTQPGFSSTGGHPGGYISGNVGSSVDQRLYSFEVSGTAIGNLTSQTLTVDYRSTGTINAPTGADVRFYITDGGSNFFVSSSLGGPNTGDVWQTLRLLVNAGNFTQVSGTGDFATVAGNPFYVGLLFSNGDFSSNSNLGFTSTSGATISIDNFGTPNSAVPIPAAIWLLGSGLVGLIGIKKAVRR
ncbi:MAG TPA: VPLPA-CTERM sorting domain-containing protein [Syntrophorhabdales bacterium]|nr:VPLPA-CTERM sorting domain-containing protein [Syntrophorhabdales bacterium]